MSGLTLKFPQREDALLGRVHTESQCSERDMILSFSVSFSGLRLLHHLPFIIHPVQTVSGQHHQMLVSSRSTAVTETTKLWRREVASIWMYIFIFTSMNLSVHICCTASLWNISHCLYLSLSTYVFTFCAISIFMLSFSLLLLLPLFLSLTIAYEVSLQNTNVLQSPWKQWELRGRQGTVREFLWCWHCYQIRSSLVCVCVCVCTCMAHIQKCVSAVFYLCVLDEICSMIVCFPCTWLRGCAGWMPAVPPLRCQIPLSCSWLSSQALCRVSQLGSASYQHGSLLLTRIPQSLSRYDLGPFHTDTLKKEWIIWEVAFRRFDVTASAFRQ